ncbi:ABC transporter ATP-binding protein [Loktanella sp. SALINAS62]|uniref:ABC transporter ATP-binding protein n=1 Tax=Loktanella sp. SALINAS62 TaxID=2706124 RepID=UPI001B8D2EB3|nr:ABC transporter ATP-binding protein [Loktanella sp. SALINAS62]MBS1303686.1 ABC transporter ATP-binding protein [Loktanella sp. SALINAS62]
MADALARLHGVTACYDGITALDLINLDLPEGQVIAFCGPNGSGKSTALRVLRGLHKVEGGTVDVAGRPLRDWVPKDLAKAVAMLSQSPEAPPELTVQDLVRLGRFTHRKRFAGHSGEDHAACANALAATEMTGLAERPIGHLSGGQMQRAWIAMTIAQEAPRIFLDEPTNHLDVAHAFEVLELVRRLNRTEGRSIVLVLHDLNMAMRYADHVVLFDAGRVVTSGPVREVLTETRVADVFGIRCKVIDVSGEDIPFLITLPD